LRQKRKETPESKEAYVETERLKGLSPQIPRLFAIEQRKEGQRPERVTQRHERPGFGRVFRRRDRCRPSNGGRRWTRGYGPWNLPARRGCGLDLGGETAARTTSPFVAARRADRLSALDARRDRRYVRVKIAVHEFRSDPPGGIATITYRAALGQVSPRDGGKGLAEAKK